MNVRDDKQLMEIRLTNAEKKDLTLRENLKDIYDKHKKKNYQGTLDLPAYNKRCCAAPEVKREKRWSAVMRR